MKIPEENNRIFRSIAMTLTNIILALFLLPISFFPTSNLPSASAQIATICNQSCQGHPVPYPFGFSDGCEIPLQCAKDGIKVGGFRVLSITSNSLRLDLPPKCNRRFGEATKLFGPNFAPTSHNELLLHNCSRNATGCSRSPSLLHERRFELQNCGPKIDEGIRCHSSPRKDGFLEFEKLNSTDCKVLVSSMTIGNGSEAGSVEMDFQKVELGWWLEGRCRMNGSCSTYSNCTDVVSPANGRSGYRCQCIEGYQGDGFVAGVGCRKVGHGTVFRGNRLLITSLISTLVVGTILSTTIIYCLWRKRNGKGRRKKRSPSVNDFTDVANQNDSIDVPFIDFDCLVEATDNFSNSNKLGKGGFGIVYKGTHSGQEIAVKRLSKGSGQGLEEFKNEAVLIAKLQHRNLVRMLGYCVEGSEKMLVYEYMPNKSLNFFLFDATLRSILDWEKRNNIIMGIARGLLYLHQDSRLRIIHRDLKTSNILLDKDMNPKISDFGMARIFGGDQMQDNTNRVVGTYGYISPEYAANGLYSVKSDVYSFGIIVLEIISGKRNADFSQDENAPSLTAYAWQLWKETRGLELVDPVLHETCNETQVLKCIHLGLLCVQDNASDRPTMSWVLAMLDGEIASLPTPNQPAFFRGCFSGQPRTGSSDRMPRHSKNEVTISTLVAR